MPNIEVMAKSLKLAWISRFLSTDVLSRKENWKAIPYQFFLENMAVSTFYYVVTIIKKF